MNASELIDLLLEVNVINAQDIDIELKKLAARLIDPRARRWFLRVPRFFFINIDRLLAEPLVAKPEPRTIRGSKYYADPRGGWVTGREPEEPGSPLPVREQYDPKSRKYITNLHQPVIQKDIEQSFRKFNPAKAKAKRSFGDPPTKKELQPWMVAPGAEEKEFFHFDPIQFRRRELWNRLEKLVHFLNYQSRLAANRKSEDPTERANGVEAENLLQRLIGMKTDDIEGFRDILHASYSWAGDVKEKPWLFTGDGQAIATYNNLIMRKVIYPETATALSNRVQPEHTNHEEEGGYLPNWCTKTYGHAESYTNQGPLYFIDKDNYPYVLVHFETKQVNSVQNIGITQNVAKEIAPLFSDRQRFPLETILKAPILAREVNIPDRSRTVMEFPEGYRLVQFTHPFDLAREGVMMDHCCGNTDYQDKLQRGTHQFYSLRDPQNSSLVTLEVERGYQVTQMKGPRNTVRFDPNIKDMLRQAIAQNHWRVEGDYGAIL